jgi:O-acetylserine/cysteine efflux transporter
VPGAGSFRTPWWALALIAALAATLQCGLIFNGLRELPASTATLVLQLQVPFAVLCAWLLGRDRPDPRRLLGIALAFAGVALVAGSPSAAALAPILLVALGSLSWAAGQAVAQVAGRDEGRTLFAGIAVHAVPQLALASALLERGQLAALRTAGASDWAAMLGLASCGFVLTYRIWYALLRRYSMDQIAPFALLMPVVGVALGALLLGERPSVLELAGGAVIVAGLALVVLRRGAKADRAAVDASPRQS